MVVVGRRAEPQRRGGGLLGRYEAGGAARAPFLLLVGYADDEGREDGALLPVGDLLDLAVADGVDGVLVRGLVVVLLAGSVAEPPGRHCL